MTTATSYPVEPGVITVEGVDAMSYLQSMLSQDLDTVAAGASAPALLLQPQGKLVATMHALHVGDDAWWCITDAEGAPALAEGLNRFRIRVKAEINDASADFGRIAVRGGDASDLGHSAISGDARLIETGWGPDIVGPRADVERAQDSLAAAGVAAGSHDDYEAARIAAGVPRLGVDVDERTIPQEAFLDETAVSFTKGCFVGQELVCRIDTRGRVNRYLRRVRFDTVSPAGDAARGAAVVAGDKVVGELTSSAGGLALAMVRREVEPPADVIVRFGDDEVQGRVEAL
jgi:tRNA-modifying protein YgfZ